MFKYLFAICSFSLISCSLYQSDGRKTLEKEAFEYAGVTAVSNLQSCAYDSESLPAEWLLVSEADDVKVFTNEREEFAMRVEAGTFGCRFLFTSAQEMVERTEAAIDLTLLHLSLGEFAFRPLSHVK